MTDNLKENHNPGKQPCRQEQEREDCFARNRLGNCDALEDTGYPCGGCPFYKPKDVLEAEMRTTYRRLIVLERANLIEKYEIRDEEMSGPRSFWAGKCRQ